MKKLHVNNEKEVSNKGMETPIAKRKSKEQVKGDHEVPSITDLPEGFFSRGIGCGG